MITGNKMQKNTQLLILTSIFFAFWVNALFAANLDKVKLYFMEGNYKSAISEGQKLIAKSEGIPDLERLYYLLGLSYLKENEYLRAGEYFQMVLKEFKDTKLKEEVKLGLADSYLFSGDFEKAGNSYKELLSENSDTKFKAAILYRLSLIEFKKGAPDKAREYLNKIKDSFPLSPELVLDKDLSGIAGSSGDIYYAVQVGVFSNYRNANNLKSQLIQKGYPAYLEEMSSQDKQFYRVRIGKFQLRKEAESLEQELKARGYSTKIFP